MSELVLEKNNGLPEKWIETSLDSISVIVLGQSPPSSTYNKSEEGLPFFQGKAEFGSLYPTLKIWCSKPKKLAEKNDVLLSVRAPVGTTNLCPEKSCIGRGLAAIRPKGDIPVRFMLYFLRYIEHDLERQGTGTTFKAISGNQIKSITIPLPPLNEQKRIVAKIEELFSKIDSSNDLLIKSQNQLRLYKTSLLNAAFLGTLSKEFREKNQNNDVTTLIRSIKENKSKQEKKLQKIDFPDGEKSFHNIPPTWKWIRVGNVCSKIQYGTSEKANGDSSGIPVLRMGNIIDGELQYDNLKYFPKNWKEKSEFLLENGDILFNRTNSAELVGKTAVYKDQPPKSVFASYLIRAKVFSEIILPDLLSYYINSLFGRLFIRSVVSQQVGQANVNGTKFSMMLIPLIPMNEQKYILEKIETSISLIKNISNEIKIRLDSLNLLKQSILKQAFEGKLIPQDSNDEPAEILLQKIKQEKQKIINSKPKRKKNDK